MPQRFHSYSEQQIIDALADRFSPSAYAFIPQVREGTGAGAARTADALAMSLWPSRGLELHGFEVKVRRNDWVRELKKPEKAEAIGQFCDRWWIAAPDKMIEVEELPPLWGLLVARGKRGSLVQVKAAERQLRVTQIDRHFLAAILRRASADCPYARRKSREYKEGKKAGASQSAHGLTHATQQVTHLSERIRAFEEASGIRLDGYDDPQKIGAAVKALIRNDREKFLESAERVANSVEVQAKRARAIADELAVALAKKVEA